MQWEPITKNVGGGPRLPFPSALVNKTRSDGHHSMSFNVIAAALLPREVVLLKRGDQLALRSATPNGCEAAIRRISFRNRNAILGLPAGVAPKEHQRYQLIPDGDLLVLMPIQ
jgi:hypothetical protein